MIAFQSLCPWLAWLLKSFVITHMLDSACLFNLWSKQIGNSSSIPLWNWSSSRGLICNLWASCLERQNMPAGWSWRTLLYNYPVREDAAVSIASWYMFFSLLQVVSSLTWFYSCFTEQTLKQWLSTDFASRPTFVLYYYYVLTQQ